MSPSQIGMLNYANEQTVIDSKEIKGRWKHYSEIQYSRDINIQDTLEDISYLQEPLVVKDEFRSALQS